MSVTSGFFNSVNGDRKYYASQMSAIFDGIINDGVFANIGTALTVKSNEGNTVNIGIGFAWFNSVWVRNDAILPIEMDLSEVLLDRYDAVVIDIDASDPVRDGTIKMVKGTPSSSPQKPAMAEATDHHQYPLAYILRKAGSTEIKQADITNTVGTSECPYITGILQVQDIDNIVAQWQDQWETWFSNIQEITIDESIALTLSTQVAELQENKANKSDLTSHTDNKSNPHGVTAAQVGALPKAGGTMTGNLVANNPAVGTKAVRNIYAGTADMTAGTTALTTGTLYLVYE